MILQAGDENVADACPRCGGLLRVRLRELECPACGYFRPLKASPQADSGEIPPPARIAPKRAPASPSLVTYEREPPWQRSLPLERILLLVVLLLVQLVGNHLLRTDYLLHFNLELQLRQIVLGSVVITGIAALLLYADWRIYARWCLAIPLLLALLTAWGLFSAVGLQSTLLLCKYAIDLLLLIWFATVFARGIAVNERG